MNSRSIIRNPFSLTVSQLFHFVFGLTLFAAANGMLTAREARGATFTVTNTGDICNSVPCSGSLRRAVIDANVNPGADIITFNISGGGVHTITLAPLFPEIFDGVTVDGTSQPNYAGVPLIEINATSSVLDIRSATEFTTYIIKGLIINRSPGSGIRVDSSIFPTVPVHVTISGCYIGTNSSGTTDLGNGVNGILIRDLKGGTATIGGISAGQRNVISGNNANGIHVDSSTTPTVKIHNNYIGTNAAGTGDLGNSGSGVLITRNSSATIGGISASLRNVISGNDTGGILVETTEPLAPPTEIYNNYIGTNAAGTGDLGNSIGGIFISSGSATISRRNIISGNNGNGIVAFTGGTVEIYSNYIGTNAAGTGDLGNSGSGIHAGAGTVIIGGTGTDGAGLPASFGNVISGNNANGIHVQRVDSRATTVQRNLIGTNALGLGDLGNSQNGILVEGTFVSGPIELLIGSSTNPLEGNVISGNSGDALEGNGIKISASLSGVKIFGNKIGTNTNGDAALPNAGDGIEIASASNQIGLANNNTARNIIAGNLGNGILLSGPNATLNLIQNNFIGTNSSGANLGNGIEGVLVTSSATANTIGGTTAGAGNTIASNASDGVHINSTAGTGNAIQRNAIHSNSGLGINLAGVGVLPNDPNDADTGANNLQNFPVLQKASPTQISGVLNSTNATFTIDFYRVDACNQNNHGEGRFFLASTSVTTAGNNAAFNLAHAGLTVGQIVTATATDANGNTSEFSECLTVTPPPGNLQFSAATYSVNETGGSATITVNRVGGTDGTITVDYATSNGTATAAQDYTVASGTLILLTNETSKTFVVPILNDNLFEGNETVNLGLSNTTGGAGLSPPSTAVLTIVDNETQPTLGINDVSLTEGNGGTKNFAFTVTLSGPSSQTVSVTYATANGTATAGSDYQATGATLTYTTGQTSKTVDVVVSGDAVGELDETFFVNLTNPTNAAIADGQGIGTIVNDDVCPNSINPTSVNATAVGGTGSVSVTSACSWTAVSNAVWISVNSGPTGSGNGTVGYSVAANLGAARTGTITIAGQTFTVNQGEGPNPIDGTNFFVTQHYRDFLNREPDAGGLQFWTNEIDGCGIDVQCREVKRINGSAAFFLSIEFQETGFLVYRFFKSAYGDATSSGVPGTVPIIRQQEFLPDTQALGQGVQVGIGDWQQQLEANKQAYALAFVQRQRFLDAFPLSLTPAQFVDGLDTKAGGVLDTAERAQLIADLTANNTVAGRAAALRRVAEDSNLRQAEFNRAFVLMQYYGYLRRNPDEGQDTNFGGWKFWLDKLNQFNGNFIQAEMVKAFISSGEYRERFFGQP